MKRKSEELLNLMEYVRDDIVEEAFAATAQTAKPKKRMLSLGNIAASLVGLAAVGIVIMMAIWLTQSGNGLYPIATQPPENGYSSATPSPPTDDPIQHKAGFIVIHEGRLYFREARVYVSIAFDVDDPFLQHAGENVILIDHLDEDRLRELGFYEDYFFQAEHEWPDGHFNSRTVGRHILYDEDGQPYIWGGFTPDADGYYWAEDDSLAGPWEARRVYGIFPNGRAVYPMDTGVSVFELTGDEVFTFVDTGFHFSLDTPLRYSNTNLDEFLQHRGILNRLHCFHDTSLTMSPEEFLLRTGCECTGRDILVFVQVQGTRIVSVTEEFLFTQ